MGYLGTNVSNNTTIIRERQSSVLDRGEEAEWEGKNVQKWENKQKTKNVLHQKNY